MERRIKALDDARDTEEGVSLTTAQLLQTDIPELIDTLEWKQCQLNAARNRIFELIDMYNELQKIAQEADKERNEAQKSVVKHLAEHLVALRQVEAERDVIAEKAAALCRRFLVGHLDAEIWISSAQSEVANRRAKEGDHGK